jgi:thioredoxin 1
LIKVQEEIMSEIKLLDSAGFPSEVLASTLPVLVEFSAAWCGPCKMLEPLLKELAQEWAGKVIVFKLDADDSSDIAMQYGVMGLPTMILFVKGEPVQRLTGYQPKDRIIAKFSPSF